MQKDLEVSKVGIITSFKLCQKLETLQSYHQKSISHHAKIIGIFLLIHIQQSSQSHANVQYPISPELRS